MISRALYLSGNLLRIHKKNLCVGWFFDDPTCVVIGASINGYQLVLFKLLQCFEVLLKPGILHVNPWHETWIVAMLPAVCQVIVVQVTLVDR